MLSQDQQWAHDALVGANVAARMHTPYVYTYCEDRYPLSIELVDPSLVVYYVQIARCQLTGVTESSTAGLELICVIIGSSQSNSLQQPQR